MRLADFIRSNTELIAAEWELFARTLLPAEEFSKSVLRNGIAEMLAEIAADMDSGQTDAEQQGKSEGEPRPNPHIDNSAELHALARVKMGLSARQVISEFRALRATVIRLWHQNSTELDELSLYDLTRFNEAVDQALTEAAVRYTSEVEKSRELFLGILGHDLRNPLAAISGLAGLQLHTNHSERHQHFASQILVSAARMGHMITDLIELTRVRLGNGIAVNPAPTDLRRICTHAVEEMKAIYPARMFRLECEQDLPGIWDEARLSQLLSNLLGNAVQHGATGAPITVTARSGGEELELTVHNAGKPIPPQLLPRLFDCLFQGAPSPDEDDTSTSLGLGLYIAKEIITAHGGTIDVQSSEAGGTIFTARLPSVIPAAGAAGDSGAEPAARFG
jgi:signal transduction histidine kinase